MQENALAALSPIKRNSTAQTQVSLSALNLQVQHPTKLVGCALSAGLALGSPSNPSPANAQLTPIPIDRVFFLSLSYIPSLVSIRCSCITGRRIIVTTTHVGISERDSVLSSSVAQETRKLSTPPRPTRIIVTTIHGNVRVALQSLRRLLLSLSIGIAQVHCQFSSGPLLHIPARFSQNRTVNILSLNLGYTHTGSKG